MLRSFILDKSKWKLKRNFGIILGDFKKGSNLRFNTEIKNKFNSYTLAVLLILSYDVTMKHPHKTFWKKQWKQNQSRTPRRHSYLQAFLIVILKDFSNFVVLHHPSRKIEYAFHLYHSHKKRKDFRFLWLCLYWDNNVLHVLLVSFLFAWLLADFE